MSQDNRLDVRKYNCRKGLNLNKGTSRLGKVFDLHKLYQYEYSVLMVIIINVL